MRPIGNSISPASQLRFSPGGQWLAAGGDDYRIRIWDLTTERVQFCPFKGLIGVDCGFSPNDTFLSVISKEAKTITFWRVQAGRIVCVREYDNPTCVVFSSDERSVLAAGSGCDAEMLEMPRRGEALWATGLGYTWGLTSSTDGKWLAWLGRKIGEDLRIGSPELKALQVPNRRDRIFIELPDTPQVHTTEIIFSPDARQIAAVGEGGTLVWNLEDGTEHSGSGSPAWASSGSGPPASKLLENPKIAAGAGGGLRVRLPAPTDAGLP